jgi:acyl-CoA reductase-like NAD-dependent aldehyde dehydrogenase
MGVTDLATRSRSEWERLAAPLRPEGRAFINGKFVAARDGRVFEKKSPIDGRVIAQVARCSQPDVDDAVAAARAAFEAGAWRRTDPKERKRVLLRFAELIRRDLEQLAMLETLDVGKPIINSIDVDVPKAADTLAYYAEFADKLYDEVAPTGPDDLALIRREPLGVVAAVVPWNYPLIITAWKLGPALLTGNSVVLKPAEQSPLTAIRMAELGAEAGLPPGVLNVVPGFGEETGKPLALHGDVDMVSFTGSTQAGKRVSEVASKTVKRVALELGGKSANVILDDADLAKAVKTGVQDCYLNSGQTCSAQTRMLVPRAKHDEAVRIAKQAAEAFTPGRAMDEGTRLGPLVSKTQQERVRGFIRKGIEEGATLVTGGPEQPENLPKGYFVKPTVFANVKNSMTIAQQEIFGPVLCIIPYEDEEDAIRIANDSPYGLAGGVWSADAEHAKRVARRIRAGQIDINGGAFNPGAPFGGYKQSGRGREYGKWGFEEFLEIKSMQV